MATDEDKVFKALADPVRRVLLDRLHAENGQTLGRLCERLAMSRQAVTKHLKVLEEASLVVPVWRGREKLHYLNPVPIHEIADRWIGKYEQGRLRALADLKKTLEEESNCWPIKASRPKARSTSFTSRVRPSGSGPR
jgi:DNA-binding transcriptional ArsR family regulator